MLNAPIEVLDHEVGAPDGKLAPAATLCGVLRQFLGRGHANVKSDFPRVCPLKDFHLYNTAIVEVATDISICKQASFLCYIVHIVPRLELNKSLSKIIDKLLSFHTLPHEPFQNPSEA